MKIKFFTIPITDISDFEQELNNFLNTNKIIEFEKKLVRSENNIFWCIFIKYEGKPTNNYYNKPKEKKKIDYVKELPPEQSKKYEQLRTIRKEIAQKEVVSAYVVATNEEIAEIAKLVNPTLADLKKINGFGNKKAEKYGKQIIEKLQNITQKKFFIKTCNF